MDNNKLQFTYGEKWHCHVCVGRAARHREFTTHQPSPPDCPGVICVSVKKQKKICLKKIPTA